MKKYFSFLRIRFFYGLQYRAAAYAGIVTQFAWGFMTILMFKAFYKSNPAAFPMSFAQLSSYVWLQQAFLALIMFWFFDSDIFLTISNGNIAYELCRPIDLYDMWFTKNLANRLAKVILRCPLVLLIAFLLPPPYSLILPQDLFSLLLFALSLVLGSLVMIALSMLVYITTFYTLSPFGLRVVAASIMEFLSGAIIPLPFLPAKMRLILQFLPFASLQDIPFSIYNGHIANSQIIFNISIQLFWLISLVFVGKLFMKRALKKIVVQGG